MNEVIFDGRSYSIIDLIDTYYISVFISIGMLLFSKHIYTTHTYKNKIGMVASMLLLIASVSTLVTFAGRYFSNQTIVSNCFQTNCYAVTTGIVTYIGHGIGRSKIIVNNKSFEVMRNAKPFFINRGIKKIIKTDTVTIYSIDDYFDGIIYLTRNPAP